MDIIDEQKVKIQPLHASWYDSRVDTLDMLRLDLVHPVVSGNKWYKLRLNVMHAKDNHFRTLVTFGGGHSNHLVATAYTARKAGLSSVGIVRGRYPELTPTLRSCREYGMQLIFVTKEDYGKKEDEDWVNDLAAHFDEIFIIPEGGANALGRKGAGLMDRFVKHDYTHVVVSVGTGTTLTGLRNDLAPSQWVLGFVPMKQGRYLRSHIMEHLNENRQQNWQLFDNWHFGGFGKWNDALIEFMNDFHATNNIPLDIVYTSKMMYGVRELITSGHFKESDKILCIHSGGLQGNEDIFGLKF